MKAGKDILSGFGPDAHGMAKPSHVSGGVTKARDVMNYSPPKGPTNMYHESPGNHGRNHGAAHGAHHGGNSSGSPGIGGTVHHCGTQGHHGGPEKESGGAGLHGSTKRHGSEK